MEKIKRIVREFWDETPNSVKFWNGLILLILIGSGIYSLEALGVLMVFGSLLTIALLAEGGNTNQNIWIFFMPISWFILLFGLVIATSLYINNNVIVPFNKWLNKNTKN